MENCMTQLIFNKQQFLQSLAEDEELARELLAAFMEDSPVRSASLGEALNADDAGAAAKLAHSLKGMCGVVRADDLVSLALAMEDSAKRGDLDKTKEQYAVFTEMLDTAHTEMRLFIDG